MEIYEDTPVSAGIKKIYFHTEIANHTKCDEPH